MCVIMQAQGVINSRSAAPQRLECPHRHLLLTRHVELHSLPQLDNRDKIYTRQLIRSKTYGYSICKQSDEIFSERVMESLSSNCELQALLHQIEDASCGDVYIFGGTIRQALLGHYGSGDLDLMVPNGDNRVFSRLKELGVPYTLNRRRHRRYFWAGKQIDINQPREWRDDLLDIEATLRHFDLRINSLAIHLGARTVIDPYQMRTFDYITDPGINWKRWNDMPARELAILVIRLRNIMREWPELSISRNDECVLRTAILPICMSIDWEYVSERFPHGKHVFAKVFERDVLRKAFRDLEVREQRRTKQGEHSVETK